MTTFTLADLIRVMESLPPNPIAPENRRYARLQPSGYVPPGTMYRLSPQPELTGSTRPTIIMHPDDIKALCEGVGAGFGNVWQDIADAAEQIFALQEARRS